jgi:ProP effector
MSEVKQNNELSGVSGANNKNGENVVQRKYSPREVLDFLIEKFPKCFFAYNSENVRPIKIGILEDIVARLGDEISPEGKYSKTAIRQGIKVYASSLAYLDACKVGAVRVDLDGNECDGPITEEQEKYAQEKKEAVKKKISERQNKARAAGAGTGNANAGAKKPRPAGEGYKKKFGGPGSKNFHGKPFNRNGGKSYPQKKTYTRPPVYLYVPVDLDTLKVGDFVSVRIAEGIAKGFVDKIEPDDIHVKMRNGNIVHSKISSLRLVVRKESQSQNNQTSQN